MTSTFRVDITSSPLELDDSSLRSFDDLLDRVPLSPKREHEDSVSSFLLKYFFGFLSF